VFSSAGIDSARNENKKLNAKNLFICYNLLTAKNKRITVRGGVFPYFEGVAVKANADIYSFAVRPDKGPNAAFNNAPL
jgi:hypothetical protein